MTPDIIEEPGIMAVRIPEDASELNVVQPENIAFSTFELTYNTKGASQSKTIDSNVEFSNVEVAGKCSDLQNERLKNWCEQHGIAGENYVVLRLKY